MFGRVVIAKVFDYWRDVAELPGGVWVHFAATLINRAGTMVLPFLVLYLTRQLGMTARTATLAVACYGAGTLLTAPVAGRLCDRFGNFRIMQVSLLGSGALLSAFPFVRGLPAILCLTFCWAAVAEAFRPAGLAFLASMTEPRQRKAAYALNRLAVNLGMSVGPLAGGFLAMISYWLLFAVDAATSIIAGVVLTKALSGRVHATEGADKASDAAGAARSGAWKDWRFLLFLLSLLPTQFALFQHTAALPLFIVDGLKLPETDFGLLILINTALIILIEIPLNKAIADWPHRRSMVVGALLFGVGYGTFAYAGGLAVAAAAVVVFTFGEMIMLPAAATYVSEAANPSRRGEFMGLYQMSFGIAFAVGPWLGVEVLERVGARPLWTATFFGCCLGAAGVALVARRAPAEALAT